VRLASGTGLYREPERGNELAGNWPWMARGSIDKYPFRFALGEHRLFSEEATAPPGSDLSPIDHPCQDCDLIVQKGRFQVLDAVHPDEPGPAEFPREPRSAASLSVANGRVLHPLNISDIVDVAICIHDFGSHSDLQTENCIHAPQV
jgi:hypothetical protein